MTATDQPATTSPSAPAPSPPRQHGLDGLRGIAAFAVLLGHTLLIVPAFSDTYLDPAQVERWSPTWWASYTPFHVVWDGSAAVFVFFVLSGYVLGLPFATHRPAARGGWARYFPRRLVRLYVPVWGAFAVAMASLTFVDRDYAAGASVWLRLHPTDIDGEAMWRHLLLLPSGPMGANGVLWTLRYEVMFSLLLPLVVVFCRTLPRLNAIKGPLLLGAAGFFFTNKGPDLSFLLPVFTLGTLLAVERDRVRGYADRIRAWASSGTVWWILSIATVLALGNAWSLRGLTTDPDTIQRLARPSLALTVAGAAGAVLLTAEGPWRHLFDQPLLRWLGSRSFSLYLVHEPIVVAVGVLLGDRPTLPWSLAVAIPVALVVAEVFFRLVERPSHRLSRWIGGASRPRSV